MRTNERCRLPFSSLFSRLCAGVAVNNSDKPTITKAQAADLHQSLTDVSMDDIDVQEALREHAKGATGRNGESGRRKLPAAAAAAAAVAAATAAAAEAETGGGGVEGWGRSRSRSRSRGGGGQGGRENEDAYFGGGEGGRAVSLSGAEDDGSGGGFGGGLVTRAIARRPLREMLR